MNWNQRKALSRKIRKFYGRDMLAATVLLAERYLASFPDDAFIWLYYGASLGQMSRFKEGVEALRRAARLFRKDSIQWAYSHLGQLYERKGNLRTAERWYRRAIEVKPSDASYCILIGVALANNGRLKKAEAAYRRAIRCKEGCLEEAFLNLGITLRNLGKHAEARRCLQHALGIDPKYKEVRDALADVEYHNWWVQRSSGEHSTPFTMNWNQRKALSRKIVKFYGRDMVASAALLAERYLANFPHDRFIWLYYGASLGQMSRFKEGIKALRRAARLFRKDRLDLVYQSFAQLYKRKGNLRIAIRWYRRAIEVLPSDATNYIRLGAILANNGRLKEAAAVYRRATRCKDGCREEAFLNLGITLRNLGKYAEARRCLQHALGIDPKYKEAQNALADVEYHIKQSGRLR